VAVTEYKARSPTDGLEKAFTDARSNITSVIIFSPTAKDKLIEFSATGLRSQLGLLDVNE
jgi:hypothetical protein